MKSNRDEWFIRELSLIGTCPSLVRCCGAGVAESPLWLLLQVSPVRNEKEMVVLLLIVVKDITALRQPLEDDTYSRGMTLTDSKHLHHAAARPPSSHIASYWRTFSKTWNQSPEVTLHCCYDQFYATDLLQLLAASFFRVVDQIRFYKRR